MNLKQQIEDLCAAEAAEHNEHPAAYRRHRRDRAGRRVA